MNSPRPQARTEAEATLLEHVIAQTGLRFPGSEEWVHPSVADLVLAHGQFFAPHPWPLERHPQRLGQCFAAAHTWADCGKETWTYVEGYAYVPQQFGTPVFDHAWCLRGDGRVADPALPDGVAQAYLGVPYAADFRAQQLIPRRRDALVTFGRDWTVQPNYDVLRDGLRAQHIASVTEK